MKKVLIIDDNDLVRTGLVTALRRNGYEVFEANHGAQGLELAFSHRPNIVLSDVNMPGQNGFDVLRELRRREETAAIPVILMTGEPQKADARHSMNQGADDYLQKPFNLEQMLETVRARLNRQDGIHRALTSQNEAERISAAEKIRLQSTALEAAANGIAITDPDGKILWVNGAFTRLTGYTADEVVGQNPRFLNSGRHSREFYAGMWATINAGNVWHGELINKCKDGSLYDEEMTITPVYDESGKIHNFIAIKQNVSERKKNEDELARKRDLLRALMDNLPDHIYFKDANSRYTNINKALAGHLGLQSPEEAIDKTDADFFPIRQARQKLVDERCLLATGKPILGLVEKSDAANQDKWVSSTKVPIYGTDGKISGLVGISRDVTEIKHAEEELQRKSAFLEAQMNSSIDGILAVDEQGKKVLQNQRLTDLLKIPQAMADDEDDKVQLRWVMDRVKDPEQFQARILHLNSQREEKSREEIEMKDGTILDRYSAPMLGKNGTYYGRMWTFRDITERKHMEASLRDSEEKFRGLVENFRDAIVTVDPTLGKFTSANPAAIKMFGAQNEAELLAHSPVSLSPERQPDGSLSDQKIRELNAVFNEGLQRFEWIHRRINGQEFFAEVVLTRMERGGKPAILSTIRDITERKQAEEKLRESEEKFRQLAAHVSDVFWMTSPDLRQVHYVSPAYERIWGRSMEKLYAHPNEWEEGVLPAERQRIAAVFRALTKDTPEVSTEYIVIRPDGTTRWVHDRGFQVRDAAGKLVRLAGITSDITERKRLETELFQARKLESVGQLAAGIAHEINTPTQYVGDNTRFVKDSFSAVAKVLDSHAALLAAAKAGTITPELVARSEEILAAGDLDYLRGQIPQALNETLEGVDRVSKIVRAMKDFSHPGTSEKGSADLNRAIESTATIARNEWKYVADMKLELDQELPFVPCFLGEFNQVVLNLIVNAAHAIGDVVAINPGTKGLITVQTRRDGNWVEVRVSDTGTGIPEAARAKIFEPFFTTKDVGRGTGQGLALVYGCVVNRHGGTVTFDTETGRGTTFIVRLPLKNKTELTDASPPPHELAMA